MTAAAHKELIRAACERLAVHGYFAWPNRTGASEIDGRYVPFGKKGSGDILAVIRSIHCEFEGKTGGAVQSKEQKIHQRLVEKHGGVYIVFHAVDELMEAIRTAESLHRTCSCRIPP